MAALLACGSRALRASARRSPLALQIRAFASSDPTVPKLPELPYDYGDLEPVISAEIMKLHHQKHHQAYINGYMQAKEKYEAAQEKGNLETMIALQPAIRFNGGGHVNHSIFWKNLCPPKGSGWGWLGYNKDTDKLVIATTANQDPLTTLGLTPLLGIDVWEHAYYLQYKNVRPDYLKNIWKVVNWKDVSSRLPA